MNLFFLMLCYLYELGFQVKARTILRCNVEYEKIQKEYIMGKHDFSIENNKRPLSAIELHWFVAIQ